MIAIQNDPWSAVPINPSLPEIASSTESADIKNQSEQMYELMNKLNVVIPYFTKDSGGDSKKDKKRTLE